MTVEEEVEATNNTTVQDLRKFYKDFYGSSHATVALVGDFDATATHQQLDKMLSNWSAAMPYTRVEEKYDDVRPENKEIKTPDKKNAMMVCGMNIKMRDDNADFPALKMGNFIFGGGFLNSRLATRIRQKEGISYGVGSFIQIPSLDESGVFGSYAIYNPDNKAKLEAAWKDELAKLLASGFTEEELKQAKAGYIQYRESGRSDDAQLAGTLNSYLFIDRKMAWDQDIDDKLQKLNATQINVVMKKYLNSDKISFVKAGDFK
jgi:zinc protease